MVETMELPRKALPEVAGFQAFLPGRIWAFANTRTTIEEIEEVHKETLRHVLARVNEEADRLEASERKRAAAEAEAQRDQDETVRAAAKRVRFD
jgi:hypothetical protein